MYNTPRGFPRVKDLNKAQEWVNQVD